MSRTRESDRLRFLWVLGQESSADPGMVYSEGRMIMRDAATVRRYAEEACNRELSGRELRAEQAASDRLVARASRLGICLAIGGDPRGYTVKLLTPKSGTYNTLGGAENGWGVPTS